MKPTARRLNHAASRHRAQGGFLLISVLILLALLSLAAVETGQRSADARQRQAEDELLFVGEQYSQAIESYWRKSPGGIRMLPSQIDDLIEDHRFPQPVRHLRKRYVDPLAPSQEWGLVRQGSALIGVYSQARGEPFRTTGFAADRIAFEGARSYSDWQFVASVNKAKLPAASTARPGLPGQSSQPGFMTPLTPSSTQPSAAPAQSGTSFSPSFTPSKGFP
jgi:type II secretory pathway pseudopilin PulG